jgi:hypothetical protein
VTAGTPRRDRKGASPARWQVPDVDETALALARAVRVATATLRDAGRSRWTAVLEPLAEPLEDGDLRDMAAAASRVRAAFGVGESVAEALPDEEALALRDGADALQRALARHEARAAREVPGGRR